MTPPPPPLWTCLCTYWGMPERVQRRTWGALFQARWSAPVAFRHSIVYFEGQAQQLRTPLRVAEFLKVAITPHVVIEVLEALAQEGVLSRHEASQVEDGILRTVDQTGAWY